jgi:hypothetical protein
MTERYVYLVIDKPARRVKGTYLSRAAAEDAADYLHERQQLGIYTIVRRKALSCHENPEPIRSPEARR